MKKTHLTVSRSMRFSKINFRLPVCCKSTPAKLKGDFMINKKKLFDKYQKDHKGDFPECRICNKEITEPDDAHYVKTKRHTEMWFHKDCIQREMSIC